MGIRSTTSGHGRIEVLQHFSEEGTDPLGLVIDAFEQRDGDVSVRSNGVHISQLRMRVKSRILKEEPPDIWVEWPGANLKPTTEAGVVADITDLWESTEMGNRFVPEAKNLAKFDGRYRCIPADIYRVNNMFYNVELFEQTGVDPTRLSNPDDFLRMLATLDEALDQPPLVLFGRDPWGALQLWETLVIAHGGASVYEALLEGEGNRHRGAIRAALETLDAALEYTPEDMEFLSSMGADNRFAHGEGAVHLNGLFAVGRFAAVDGFEYGTDWGHVPFPGTQGAFLIVMNALVPSADTEGNEGVREFLEFAGSAKGLEIFNAEVGGVPPRTDVRVDELHPLIQEQQRALETANDQVGSMTHGLGVTPEKLVGLKQEMATFLSDRDVSATTSAIAETL